MIRQAFSDFIDFLLNYRLNRKFLRFLVWLFRPKKDVKIKVQGQTMYACSFDRVVALYLRKFSFLERSETDLFKSFVRKGMMVVDIGANLGYYTLIAADLVGPQGKVFAFEPDPENFRLLLKNIEANGYRNVKAVNQAVTDKTGKAELFLCEESSGSHSIHDFGEKRKSITVSSTSLDDFLGKRFSRVDLVKIDVEGVEPIVFSGMKEIIKANPKLVIITEFWPHALKKAGFDPADFLKTLEDQDFLIHLINEDGKEPQIISRDDLLLRHGNKKSSINLLLKRE